MVSDDKNAGFSRVFARIRVTEEKEAVKEVPSSQLEGAIVGEQQSPFVLESLRRSSRWERIQTSPGQPRQKISHHHLRQHALSIFSLKVPTFSQMLEDVTN